MSGIMRVGSGVSGVAGLCGLLFLVAGCADRERLPTDPAGFTERAWDFFSQGDIGEAMTNFETAIRIDPDFGEAYVGLGWARLRLAQSVSAMEEAVSSFDSAASRGESGADVASGKAAAELAIGSAAALTTAISLAQNARAQSPSFQFQHQTNFDVTDLFLIEAFALAAQGNIASALTVADAAPVGDSGIVAGTPSTWQVNGTAYSTFEGAALAFLHKLSEEHAG